MGGTQIQVRHYVRRNAHDHCNSHHDPTLDGSITYYSAFRREICGRLESSASSRPVEYLDVHVQQELLEHHTKRVLPREP